jgi:hypothetical protein
MGAVELRVGDRVRVSEASRVDGYRPGDTGRVAWVSRSGGSAGAVVFYHCEMDRTGGARLAAFYPGEVERAG